MFFARSENFVKRKKEKKQYSIKSALQYLTPYKSRLVLMFVLLLLGTLITLVFPFLTQNLIDRGITPKDVNFIVAILIAQLALYVGNLTFDILRNWIVLFVGTKVSIKIISDFLKKMLKLPLKFFESKMIGDFNQRIADNERIENFLTSQSIYTLFSFINFIVFFGVLWYYDYTILLAYLVLTTMSLLWAFYWLKKRRFLDYFRFQYRAENQNNIYELFSGVTEMKLNNFEDYKRNEWEKIQYKLFKLNIRVLKIDQLQLSGFEFFNQIKNIFVTFLSAIFVVNGKMTLGELLSVSYIIGQLNSPVNQLISFFRSLQDAKLSLERINEVQEYPNEEKTGYEKLTFENKTSIVLQDVSYQYQGSRSPYALKDINLTIPYGKITAIVGASGSGKTTLLKLLLRFFNATEGAIFYGNQNILDISPENLRNNCGSVMQDGYIFSDTIMRNIITSDENPDEERLKNVIEIANLTKFVEALPLKLNTKIGSSGNQISGGERQRILIARAVYKNPNFLFFDEATNALDANNEKVIVENLQDFYMGKTVVIVAHRLSTVKNADKIVVLNNGQIAEQGNHAELTKLKGAYFELVRNQLELGN
jgi:ATP-binding cassette subfamily B protein